MAKKTLIVIGNGMVGHHFLEQFADTPAAAGYDIHVFGEEPLVAYDRVHLSEYFGGSTHEDLALGTTEPEVLVLVGQSRQDAERLF